MFARNPDRLPPLAGGRPRPRGPKKDGAARPARRAPVGSTPRPVAPAAPGELLVPAGPTRAATAPVLHGWVIEAPLAAGKQAEVFLVRPAVVGGASDERRYVAKAFRRRACDRTSWSPEEQQWRMLREVVALRLLECAPGCNTPRVVTFGTCLDPACLHGRPWYVMPHYEAGAMWQAGADGAADRWAEPYRGNVDRVLDIAASLAATLAAMHDGPRRIVHRDVTPANVFFGRVGGAPILGDLGNVSLAGFADRPVAATWSAPACWRPPELDRDDGHHFGPAGDVFMLGGLVYQALSGGRTLPPAGDWDGGSVHSRRAHTLRQDTQDPRILPVEALLERMLARDTRHRLPAREIARVCRAIRSLPTTGSADGAP